MAIGSSTGAEELSQQGRYSKEKSAGDEGKFDRSLAYSRKAGKASGNGSIGGGQQSAGSELGADGDNRTKAETPPGAMSGAAGEAAPLDPEQRKAQQRMFQTFVKGVDPEAQKRLSTWLPDALGGDKKALETAFKGLTAQQRADVAALAEANGFDSKDATALQQRFGEHALKTSTPGLAPTASYDTQNTLDATKAKVYDDFTSGLDAKTKAQLETWFRPGLNGEKRMPKSPNAEQGAALEKLAKLHGLEKEDARLKSVMTAYNRQEALATAGELPSVVDMMLVQHDGRDNGATAADINVRGDNINARVAEYEKAGFGALDSWLPAALVGKGEIPKGDAEAMELLGRFATNMGFKGGADATPEQAFAFLQETGAIDKALHPSRDGKGNSFLLFSDTFLDSTIKYGAKNGAVTGEIVADSAHVAEMLLGPGNDGEAPRALNGQALTAAVLHRTDKPLERQQELMAAAGYINSAGTLGEQKTRLTESLLAFHVREEVGTAPMTARQWGASYAEVHPDLYGQMDERAFNSPTGDKMQIVTAHLGVPGDHKFMIDKKRKIKMSNDDLGNVESFDLKKKKKKWYKSVIDIAVPVIGTVLTIVPGTQAIGIGINAAYSAYKGAQAVKHGDMLGGALAIAGGVTGGAASYLGSAATAVNASATAMRAASTAANLAKGVAVANGAVNGVRAAKEGDILGVVTSGLSATSSYTGQNGFQTTANGINTGRAIDRGDYLAAGAGIAGIASDIARPPEGVQIARHSDTSLALNTLSQGLHVAHGIKHDNYAGIGNALANGIQSVGQHRLDQQKIEEAEAKAAASDLPSGFFGDGSKAPRVDDVRRNHQELIRSAEELDQGLAEIDQQLRQRGNSADQAALLERRADLQQQRDVVGIRQDGIRAQTHALASQDSYNDVSKLGADSPIERLTETELREGGFDTNLLRNAESGYFASVYKDKVTGKIIIANRGTEGINDLPATLLQAGGNLPKQYQQAIDLGREARRAFGTNIDFTGHSLGGGLAAIQIATTGLDGTTFNATGLHPANLAKSVFGSETDTLIQAYHVKSEPLTSVQDQVELGPFDFIPDANGERIAMPTMNSQGEPAGFLERFTGTIDLHGIGAVRESLNEYFHQVELRAWANMR